jgi:hypothetical protein
MARRRGNETSRASPVRKPTEEDFSAAAVQRWVLWETVQHPATILPAAGAVVSALWNGAFGVSPSGLAVTLGLVFVGGSAWIYNFFFRGEQLAEGRVQSLLRESAAGEEQELEELARRCRTDRLLDGAKEAEEILAAYRRLCSYLDDHSTEEGNINAERLRSLARDTFREGVALTKQALATWQAINAVDVTALERELKAWEKALAKNLDMTAGERIAKEQQIESHRKRLQSVDGRKRELAEILAQLNELEGALERAYLESVNVIEQDPASLRRVGSAATQLERAVAAARRVEDRLRDTGPKDIGSDAVYYEAGKRGNN